MPELRMASERSTRMGQSILAELPALEAGLGRIRLRVGFVHGSRSPMPVAASTDAAERIPGAWVDVVDGAGHPYGSRHPALSAPRFADSPSPRGAARSQAEAHLVARASQMHPDLREAAAAHG